MEPPKVSFQTPIYHPNIDNHGRICLEILVSKPKVLCPHLKGKWTPSFNLSAVLVSIRMLLSEPNPDDPLTPEIGREYIENRERFNQTAASLTRSHAVELPAPRLPPKIPPNLRDVVTPPVLDTPRPLPLPQLLPSFPPFVPFPPKPTPSPTLEPPVKLPPLVPDLAPQDSRPSLLAPEPPDHTKPPRHPEPIQRTQPKTENRDRSPVRAKPADVVILDCDSSSPARAPEPSALATPTSPAVSIPAAPIRSNPDRLHSNPAPPPLSAAAVHTAPSPTPAPSVSKAPLRKLNLSLRRNPS